MRIAVVDIGGTCIKSGIWENDKITELKETQTDAKLGGDHVMEVVMNVIGTYDDFQAIGISTAGQVNSKSGVILYANENIPGYTGMQVKKILEEAFQVPVSVQNDVNCAAIGEAYYGAGTEYNDFLCLTYGTGVGGAIIINGKVYTGSGFSAGEFGAIVTHPEERDPKLDAFSGCYEKYASTTALVKRMKKVDPSITNGREIFQNIHRAEVKRQVDDWIDEVIYGLTTLIHVFNPSLIVLGGGVMEQEYIISEIRNKIDGQIMKSFTNVKIVPAKLGNMAGMLGASQEALEAYHEGN